MKPAKSIGALWLRLRRELAFGLRVVHYRRIIAPQILRMPPATGCLDKTCEIHVLTSSEDWLNLVWVLKSFYCASRRRYALCIHDDGTLVQSQIEALSKHFPEARIILKQQADAIVLRSLLSFPHCLQFRRTNHLAPKLFDFAHFLDSERMLLLDSDVLFFREPTDLLRRIDDPNYHKNTVNGDIKSAYTVSRETARDRLNIDLIERFNSGLGLIHRNSLRLDWLEEFLAVPGIIGHFWRIEQTLFALCSSRFGVELLPCEYDVRLNTGINDSPCRHYVGAIRHHFYREGIRRLVQDRTVEARIS